MKAILVPTDFSEISKNALEYAIEISKLTKARIILFHAYHIPVITTESIVMTPSLKEIEQICMTNLEEIKRDVYDKHGEEITIECKCVLGLAVDEINLFVKTNSIDLIIMGMQGAGYLTEKLIGSVTTSLLRECNCPVMAIDQNVKFRALKKIVLTCDYNQINGSILFPLKNIAKIFNSHIYILNVVQEMATDTNKIEAAVCRETINHILQHTSRSFHNITNDNVVDGINNFVSNEQMDMVVMIPRKHTLLRNFFHEPNTKRIAFHSHVPVLALHKES